MKFSKTSSCLALLSSFFCSVRGLERDGAQAEVKIIVHCNKGLAKKLDLDEQDITATALMDSFNQISQDYDKGDKYLEDLSFLEEDDNDRELGRRRWKGPGYWVYTGGYGCRLCLPMDDFVYPHHLMLSSGSVRAWESAFESALSSTSHKALQKAGKCNIKIRPKDLDDEFEDEDNMPSENSALEETEPDDPSPVTDDTRTEVKVVVHCNKGLAKKLDPKEQAYSSKALLKSFNKVHRQSDKYIDQVSFLEEDDNDRELGRRRWTGPGYWVYTGGYGCRLCLPMDDFVYPHHLMLSSGGLQAWQKEFEAALSLSPYKALQKARQCSIRMKAKEDPDQFLGQAVNIEVTCTGGNIPKQLSTSAIDFSASSLEQSFDLAYGKSGPHSLRSTTFKQPSDAKALLRSGSVQWSTIYTASLDSDGVIDFNDELRSNWMEQYVEMMSSGPFEEFAQLGQCSVDVTMSEHMDAIE